MKTAFDAQHESESQAVDFFTNKTITKALKPKPKRSVPPFKITSNLMHETMSSNLQAQQTKLLSH
ncbi:hypothetical protein DPMN_084440 [Dreissena polymorpha]|uniref:Uncharacterized protein n=1 Tax=Dreissena polymorpha TaxID=45954 RepID=A0A9D3YAJ4_DREPO|nr:hypothetical protein DPMN_084440 [Dreissena polymorpha]